MSEKLTRAAENYLDSLSDAQLQTLLAYAAKFTPDKRLQMQFVGQSVRDHSAHLRAENPEMGNEGAMFKVSPHMMRVLKDGIDAFAEDAGLQRLVQEGLRR